MRSSLWIVAAVVLSSQGARADQRPTDVMFPMKLEAPPAALVNSHVLFLNNCQPSGCKVTSGSTDSTTDHSDIVSAGQHTIGAFPGNVSWSSVMTCVKNVMAPFNITVTDVDPGTVPHFEVMIGGSPSQVGLPSQVGGIADYLCGAPGQCSGQYVPNALVFDFADVWGGDITAICGTAAQEIAHAWTLDHSTLSNDPMTYKPYTTSGFGYHDASPCGSDCVNGMSPFGLTCTGSGNNATHTCMGTGMATQNELQIITALFGPAGAQAPTVAITSPGNGTAEQTGMAFNINVTCTTGDGIQEIDLSIDGVVKATLKTSPATFMAPATLAEGTHHLSVLCATNKQATATATADVIVGTLCAADTDCPMNDICYEKACIAGPNAAGGLGATCATNNDCKQMSCASDGSEMLCVVPCDLNNDQCPAGFGCLAAGTNGVCWLGADKSGGGGCCQTGGDSRGSILLGLGFAAAFVLRKKRR